MSVETECKCVRDNIPSGCKCESVEEAECCGNCKYWLSEEKRSPPSGICRLKPPAIALVADWHSWSQRVPHTDRDWWCGEWKAK